MKTTLLVAMVVSLLLSSQVFALYNYCFEEHGALVDMGYKKAYGPYVCPKSPGCFVQDKCPQLDPPSPDWCKDGKQVSTGYYELISVESDSFFCPNTPSCYVASMCKMVKPNCPDGIVVVYEYSSPFYNYVCPEYGCYNKSICPVY